MHSHFRQAEWGKRGVVAYVLPLTPPHNEHRVPFVFTVGGICCPSCLSWPAVRPWWPSRTPPGRRPSSWPNTPCSQKRRSDLPYHGLPLLSLAPSKGGREVEEERGGGREGGEGGGEGWVVGFGGSI